MKRTLSLLALVASLSAGAENLAPAGTLSSSLAAWAGTAVANPASSVQQFTLRNGMQLIVQPDRRAPTACRAWHTCWST